ncbi:MAG: chemotaxis protein CheA, partial [Phycisphaerales bacterium]|nr:chemotaxis protein CheA [Phycisphaerales bacterium]
EAVLAAEGVISNGAADAPVPSAPTPTSAPAPSGGPDVESKETPEESPTSRKKMEQTIRVEVGRLESLMNLVGELVLQKNRICALSRQVENMDGTDQDTREAFNSGAGNLDRVTADIQVAVMRTRMQPLDKIFGKYPRLIRDLATKTGKQIDLVIHGGDTEVDKSVIEELGDPLVHLMRNSADHGLEPASERVASGKGETGTIHLKASHEGSHVRIQIIDDGRGLPRQRIAAKAIERGLTTEAEVATLSDRDVHRFIFLPGFSTADQVSDLSGRGVGMDVVRTNIEKLKGTIDVTSEEGVGTTFTITIPLTVAIMPAMMVGVADEIYAIPLGNILEIVRPDVHQLSTIGEHPVMRLRDSVLPLINACDVFDVAPESRVDAPFAVVMTWNEKTIGLMVSKLIGQQEIVIKPLDEMTMADRKGPVSGATVRDDGGVSLIVDVAELIRIAEGRQVAATA